MEPATICENVGSQAEIEQTEKQEARVELQYVAADAVEQRCPSESSIKHDSEAVVIL